MSSTTWLFAFDQAQLRSSTREINTIVTERDDARWHAFWQENGPAVTKWAGLDSVRESVLPQPGSTLLVRLLRVSAQASALRRVELVESAWHVHYPDLSDDAAGFRVSESEEYEAIGRYLYATSAMPPGLEFLDAAPDAATNWISPGAVRTLWELEQQEGMLATAGRHMSGRSIPLGHDFLAIRDMLEFAVSKEAALHMWSGS